MTDELIEPTPLDLSDKDYTVSSYAYLSPQETISSVVDATSTDIVLGAMPYLGAQSAAIIEEMSLSGMDPVDIVQQGVAAISAGQIVDFADSLSNLPASYQRSIWNQLTETQQAALLNSGQYNAPVDADTTGWLGRQIYRGVNLLGQGWSATPSWLRTGVTGTFAGPWWALEQGADLAPKVWRATQQLDDKQKAVAYTGAAVGVGLLARGRARGAGAVSSRGGLLGSAAQAFSRGGTLAQISKAAGAGMAGMAAGGVVATAPSGFNDLITAYRTTWDGDRSFKPEVERNVRDRVNNDTITGLLTDLSIEIDPYNVAVEVAALRDIGTGGELGQVSPHIDSVAAQFGEPGTPEFEEAKQAVIRLLLNPEFEQAVIDLAQSKTSFGRDIATAIGFDLNSTSGSRVSGFADGMFILATDPLNLLGPLTRTFRLQRHALRTGGAVPVENVAQRLTALYGSHKTTTRALDELFGAVSTGNYKATPWALRPFYSSLRDHMVRNKFITDDNTILKTFGFSDFIDYVTENEGLAILMSGAGTRAMKQDAVFKPLSMSRGLGRLRKELLGASEAFTQPLEARTVKRAQRMGMSPDDVVGGQISQMLEGGKAIPFSQVAPYKPRITEPGGIGYALAKPFVWVEGVVGRPIGRILELAQTSGRAPMPGMGIDIVDVVSGANGPEFVERVGRIFKIPAHMRDSFTNAFMNASPAGRVAIVKAYMDRVFTYTGLKNTEEGKRLYDIFVTKAEQAFNLSNNGFIVDDAVGSTTNVATLIGQNSPFIAVPSVKDLLKARKQAKRFGTLLGVGKPAEILENVNGIWKVLAVMRPAFIPRAVGEEAMAMIARGNVGEIGSMLGARRLVRFKELRQAQDDLATKGWQGLTQSQRDLLLKSRRLGDEAADAAATGYTPLMENWNYLRVLHPLVGVMDRLGGGRVVDAVYSTYNKWLERTLTHGLNSANTTAAVGLKKFLGITRAGDVGERQFISRLLLGRENSWRRVGFTGVDAAQRMAIAEYTVRHAGSIMRGVGAESQSRFAEANRLVNPRMESDEGLPFVVARLQSDFENYTLLDDDYSHSLMATLHEVLHDPIQGPILQDLALRVLPDDLDLAEFGRIIKYVQRGRDPLTRTYLPALMFRHQQILDASRDRHLRAIAELEENLQFASGPIEVATLTKELYAHQAVLQLFDDVVNGVPLAELRFASDLKGTSLERFGVDVDEFVFDHGAYIDDIAAESAETTHSHGFILAAMKQEFKAQESGSTFYGWEQIERFANGETITGPKRFVYRGIPFTRMENVRFNDDGSVTFKMAQQGYNRYALTKEGESVATDISFPPVYVLSTTANPEMSFIYAAGDDAVGRMPAVNIYGGVVFELDADELARLTGTTWDAMNNTRFGYREARDQAYPNGTFTVFRESDSGEMYEEFAAVVQERAVYPEGEVITYADEITFPAGTWRTVGTGELDQLSSRAHNGTVEDARWRSRVQSEGLEGVSPAAVAELMTRNRPAYETLQENYWTEDLLPSMAGFYRRELPLGDQELLDTVRLRLDNILNDERYQYLETDALVEDYVQEAAKVLEELFGPKIFDHLNHASFQNVADPEWQKVVDPDWVTPGRGTSREYFEFGLADGILGGRYRNAVNPRGALLAFHQELLNLVYREEFVRPLLDRAPRVVERMKVMQYLDPRLWSARETGELITQNEVITALVRSMSGEIQPARVAQDWRAISLRQQGDLGMPGSRPLYRSFDEAQDEWEYLTVRAGLTGPHREHLKANQSLLRSQTDPNGPRYILESMPRAGEQTVFTPHIQRVETLQGAFVEASQAVDIANREEFVAEVTMRLMNTPATRSIEGVLNEDTFDDLAKIVEAYVNAYYDVLYKPTKSLSTPFDAARNNGGNLIVNLTIDDPRTARWLNRVLNGYTEDMGDLQLLTRTIDTKNPKLLNKRTQRTNSRAAVAYEKRLDYLTQQQVDPDKFDEAMSGFDMPAETREFSTSVGTVYGADDYFQADLRLLVETDADVRPFSMAVTDHAKRQIEETRNRINPTETTYTAIKGVYRPRPDGTGYDEVTGVIDPRITYTDINGEPLNLRDPVHFTRTTQRKNDHVAWPIIGPMIADAIDASTGRATLVSRRAASADIPDVALLGDDDFVTLTYSRLSDAHKVDDTYLPDTVIAPKTVVMADPSRNPLARTANYFFNDLAGRLHDGTVRNPLAMQAFVNRREVAMANVGVLLNYEDATRRDLVEATMRQFLPDEFTEYVDNAANVYGQVEHADVLAMADVFSNLSDDLLEQLRDGVITPQEFVSRIVYDENKNIVAQAFNMSQPRQQIHFKELLKTNAEPETWQSFARELLTVRRAKESMTEAAAIAAINDVIPFIDSQEIKSLWSQYMRNIIPFHYAEENFIKRWVRGVANDETFGLKQLRKAQLTYLGGRSAGFIQENEYGDLYVVYPGSGLFSDFMANTLGLVDKHFGKGTERPVWGSRLSNLLPGFNEQAFTPGVGALAATPVSFLSYVFPELEPFKRNVLGDIGASTPVWTSFLPSYIGRFASALTVSEQDAIALNSMMNSIIQMRMARDDVPPETASAGEIQEFLDDVRKEARLLLLTRAVLGLGTPGSPNALFTEPSQTSTFDRITGLNIENPASVLTTKYRDYVSAWGFEEGFDRFVQEFPDWKWSDVFVNPEAFTVGKSTTAGGASLPPTEQAMQFYFDNEQTAAEYPLAFAYLLPLDTGQEFNSYAWGQQFRQELRRAKAPQEFYESVIWNSTAHKYFAIEDQFEIDFENAAGNPTLQRELREQADIDKQYFLAANPMFDSMLQDSGERQVRRKNTIDQLRVMLYDPAVEVTSMTEPLQLLIKSFDNYTARRKSFGNSRSMAVIREKEQLKIRWRDWLAEFVINNPSLEMLVLSVIEPESKF